VRYLGLDVNFRRINQVAWQAICWLHHARHLPGRSYVQKGEHAPEAQAVPIQKLHEMRCAAELEEDKETKEVLARVILVSWACVSLKNGKEYRYRRKTPSVHGGMQG